MTMLQKLQMMAQMEKANAERVQRGKKNRKLHHDNIQNGRFILMNAKEGR